MRVRALCFDFGGTLDGPGQHWLDRFLDLYRAAGVSLPRETIRAAFDHATAQAYGERSLRQAGFDELIEFHVTAQLEFLEQSESSLAPRLVSPFLAAARQSLTLHRPVLERLRRLRPLGVISNFYGNVDRLLDEAGLLPLFEVVLDSNVEGLSKPDPEIFHLAARRLGLPGHEILHVGDSFPKDVLGAHAAGWKTAWLVPSPPPPCPDPRVVDLHLHSLADLEHLPPP